jgi:hypothetical protein
MWELNNAKACISFATAVGCGASSMDDAVKSKGATQ